MKKLAYALLLTFLAISTNLLAQQRYLEPVFTQASKTTAIYGSNFTALTLPVTGHTMRQPLVMDVYQPVGDTEAERPLVIYLHTGNFLPYPQNQSCGGTIGDSSNVEIANRLSKMGYVVAVADYRLGWNPLATGPTGELTRRSTLINAAYRGVQDVRTCIRYFKRSVVENGNPWKVDTSRIVVWGQGTGGYISLAVNALDQYSEILNTSFPHKFEIPAPPPVNWVPMVIEQYNGDIFGTSGPTIVDAIYNQLTGGAYPIGDTVCVPNHVGYSSDFQLCVNMGGALGDSLWLEADENPIIGFHVPSDPFAPCGTDVLIVPTTGDPVVEVSGSCDVGYIAKRLGLNAIFSGIPDNVDPYGNIADSRNDGRNGLFLLPNPNTSSPWEWSAAPPMPATCNTNRNTAVAYIDTIIKYYAPRACLALNLGCGFVKTKDVVSAEKVQLKASPNPAHDYITLQSNELYPMEGVELYDASGRMIRARENVSGSTYLLQRKELPNGFYIAKVYFKDSIAATRIIFE
ncbi:MAG: hypothetical protein EPGJADBJ_01499 [Saprospiraceae bacterium]|nr:hypothetical protein [Saprospiraceae bacterium]